MLSYLTIFAHNLTLYSSCALLRAKDNDLSVWLSVLLTERDNFDLKPQEFRDALAICMFLHFVMVVVHLPL